MYVLQLIMAFVLGKRENFSEEYSPASELSRGLNPQKLTNTALLNTLETRETFICITFILQKSWFVGAFFLVWIIILVNRKAGIKKFFS